MAKSYNGLDRTEAFFAHYGRKGMKRGMNIYNPDYKPIGEKAQLTNKAVKAKKTKLSDSGVSKEQIMQASSKKTGEAAAKESAFRSSQQYMANTRRERLLNAERQRQATSGTAANEAAKHQKSADKNNAKDSEYINAVESLYLKDVEGLDAISKQISNSNPDAAHTNQYLNELLSEAKKALDAIKEAKLSGDKDKLNTANHNYNMTLATFMKQYITAMSDRSSNKNS